MKQVLKISVLLVLLISQVCQAQVKPKKFPSPKASVNVTETLTNASIIELHQAGLSEDVILSKLSTTAAKLDVSSMALIALKKQGVSDRLIAAIVDKASGKTVNVSPSPAVPAVKTANVPELDMINIPHYLDKTLNKAVPLEAKTAKSKLKMNILKAFNPLSSAPVMLQIDNPTSTVKLAGTSSFIINCGPVTSLEGTFGLYQMHSIKDYRETLWQKVSGLNLNADKDVISYTYKLLHDGIYEVIPTATLQKGEYCFVSRTSFVNYKDMKADVFAFTIE